MTAPRNIRLLLSDVDGTLVTPDKQLTPAAIAAAGDLERAGILLAIASSRPPRGLRRLIAPLGVRCPIAAFNGGIVVTPDLSPLESHPLDPAVARRAVALIIDEGLDAWVYSDAEWFVRDARAPHVARETGTIQFAPVTVPQFSDNDLARAFKIVGVSDDPARIAFCTAALRAMAGPAANVANSQSYYIDVTHPVANKGAAVRMFAKRLDIPKEQIATLGDASSDVPMFRESGFSIAMGNADDTVKAEAKAVTASNAEDGFAQAVRMVIGLAQS